MIIDDIALTLYPNLGNKTAIALMECFGSAEKLFAANVDEMIERIQLKPALAKSISRREYHAAAEKELEFARRNRIRVLAWDSPEYPRLLAECADYPQVIYVKGDLDFNSEHWLSIVGTRNISSYGLKMCDVLIGELSEMFPDLVVASGLAFGVDIASHRAAMLHKAKTVGVVAHPLTHIYPSRHTESARRMVGEGGAVVSEYNTTCNPDRSGFVQRNRIIAGLSMGTLIVESAAKGGSLITADMAFGYDRTVMAVPGRVGDPCSEGTNRLIRSMKAQMVCSASDIAEYMGWEVSPEAGKTAQPPPEPSLFGDDPALQNISDRVLALIGSDTPVALDELSARIAMPVKDLSTVLLDLEFSGKIRSLPGKLYVKY